MQLELWLAYLLAVTVILVVPGPTIILVISQAIHHGRRSVIPLVLGVVSGDFTAMVCSLLGLGALLSLSAMLFIAVKWIGAAYLVFLGIKLWRSKPTPEGMAALNAGNAGRSLFRSSYVVTSLNPKGIVFFSAFLPQFVDPSSAAVPQLVALGTTFLVLAGVNATLYALFAGQLREWLSSPRVRRWFNRCGATALIGAGIATAAVKRA